MKKIIILAAGMMLGTVLAYAQDIPESQVPSVVLNNFKKAFPRAADIEWEMKGAAYQAEFEIGFADHEALFDSTGVMTRHEAEIESRHLPEAVSNAIKKTYPGFRVSDVKKISRGNEVTYETELEKAGEDWNVVFDTEGRETAKRRD